MAKSDSSVKLERKRRRRCSNDDVSESDGESVVMSCNKKKKIKQSLLAEPLIRCAWSGDFDVHFDESIYHRRIYSFNAFLSSKACPKVRDMTAAFEQVLFFEMLPAASVWPKSFRESGPTDDDIGLYFFPPLPMHEPLYDALVSEMIHGDIAMRASVNNDSELLIFTSAELPTDCGRRFQGKFYLWGVFRPKI